MPANDPKKLSGIFISYRRSDNPDAVGRIYDRLVSEFGKARVFKDVDSIPLGQDFRSHLNEIVGNCAAVLAIIGPRWVDTRNEAGQRRLEDPDDFVRIELEAALSRSVPVVPVLVGHAPIPGSSQLPSSLSSLAFRQSIEVRPDPDFHNDATRLVSALRVIVDPNAPPEPRSEPATAVAPPKHWRRFAWVLALAGVLFPVAIALGIPDYFREPPPQEMRTDIVTPETDQPFDFAISPDGRHIAFVAKGEGVSRLWLRSLAAATAQPLPGTDAATSPFWSPDSRSIGFFARGALKRIDISGGQPQNLTTVAGSVGNGAWSEDGVILFTRGPVSPLFRVSANGGAATEATTNTAESSAPRLPYFLPGGKRFLFTALAGTHPGVYLATLDGSTPTRLLPEMSGATYLPSGWILWMRNGALLAQQLDLEKAALTGQPQTLADGVGAVSVSATGLVAYRIGSTRRLQLQWKDGVGAVQSAIGEPDPTTTAPRISPDGQRIALSRLSSPDNRDVWLLDGGRFTRVTFDAATDAYPAWSPDGSKIAFTSARSGGGDLYQKLTSGAGAEELLLTTDQIKFPSSWSADGRYLLYFSVDPEAGANIWVLPMTGERKPFKFLETPFSEVWGQFSPDGRWVAYQSDESGRDEVYVRPFVEPGSKAANGQWQVSTSGGVHPVWRADGRAIYYISPEGEMMSASISVQVSAVLPGTPLSLFHSSVVDGGIDRTQGRQYDVATDGRFLINAELESRAMAPITLIQNWSPDAGK